MKYLYEYSKQYMLLLDTDKSKVLDLTFLMLNAVAVVAQPFHFVGTFLLMPPYTGYFMYNVAQSVHMECPNALQLSLASIPIRILSGLMALVTSTPSVNRAITAVVVDILFGTLSVRQFLRLLQTDVTGKQMVLGTMKNLKSIQLLVQSCNQLYASGYYSITIAIAGEALITFAVGAFNLRNEMPLSGIMCLVVMSFAGLVYVYVSLAATVKFKVEYEHLVENVKAAKLLCKSRLLRRIVKSSAPLSVKIGSVNFVDRATAGCSSCSLWNKLDPWP
jgi:hypothetical protein